MNRSARALVYADAQGLTSHGVARIPQYRDAPAQRPRRRHRRTRRRPGRKVARGARRRALRAGVPRVRAGRERRIAGAREFGVAFVGVTNSHHFGVAAYHPEPVGGGGIGRPGVGESAVGNAGGRRNAAAAQ